MDPLPSPVHLGLIPSLLFHATGAVTFVGSDETEWDDDVVFAVAA